MEWKKTKVNSMQADSKLVMSCHVQLSDVPPPTSRKEPAPQTAQGRGHGQCSLLWMLLLEVWHIWWMYLAIHLFPIVHLTSELRNDLRSAKLKPTSRALALPFRWSRSSPACDLSTMDSGWLRSSSFALPNDKSSRYGFSRKLLSAVLVAVCFYLWVLLFFLLLFEDVAVVVQVVVVAEVVVLLLLVCDVA